LIISASRRTDIPAFHADWFMNCIRYGKCTNINPYNKKESIVYLTPKKVDCIVFWTKDARPIMKYLDQLTAMGYRYYFQYTMTAYGNDIERNVDKQGSLETILELSEKLGKDKVIWRYDPILISTIHNVDYHVFWFKYLVDKLKHNIETCVISFLDQYHKNKKILEEMSIRPPTQEEIDLLVGEFKHIVEGTGITIKTCCENTDLEKTSCIDRDRIMKITGRNLIANCKVGQRSGCNCYPSVDIGSYGTCGHGCVYCYAK
jgi:hypothetical protein